MGKKLTQNAILSESAIPTFEVGIDIGYGFVKVFCEDRAVIFPSVAGLAVPLTFQRDEILAAHPGELITDPYTQMEWFVGNLAISQISPDELIVLQGRGNAEESMRFRVRMLHTALAKIIPHQNGKSINVTLSTGLPVDHMGDKKLMIDSLVGVHPIHTDNVDMIVTIETCHVSPQPKGTIYQAMLNADGEMNENYNFERVAVFDIGNVTLDGTVDENGKFVRDESGSLEGGVFAVRKRISNLYEAQYKSKPSYDMLEQILRHKTAKIQGKPVDFSDWVDEAVAPLRNLVLSFIGRLWDKALEIDIIFVTGGGAYLVWDDIRKAYPQAVLVEDAQMSNARGYLYYARFKAKN